MDEKQGSVAERRAAARASWERVIGEYAASGGTAAAFCRERGLRVWQFRYWLKALRQAEAASAEFVELSSDVRDPGVWVACGRWRVHVGDGFDAGVLRRVAEALA
jgi:hypothetical protein